MGEGYKSYDEYLTDLEEQINMMIECYDEFIDLGEKCDKEKLVDRALESFNKTSKSILSKVYNTKFFIAFEYVKEVYLLDEFSFYCFVLFFFYDCNSRIKDKLCALLKKVNSDLNFEFMSSFFYLDFSGTATETYEKVKTAEGKLNLLCFEEGTFSIYKRLKSFLISNGRESFQEKGLSVFVPSDEADEELIVNEDVAGGIVESLRRLNISTDTVYVHLHGCKGSGKMTTVKRVSELLDMIVVMVDVSWMNKDDEKGIKTMVTNACREQLLNQGMICFYNFDAILQDKNSEDYNEYAQMRYINFILNTAYEFSSLVFILSSREENVPQICEDRFVIDIKMPALKKEDSIKLWQQYLSNLPLAEDVSCAEMSNKFNFTPGQIFGAAKEAEKLFLFKNMEEMDAKNLCRCAYTQVSHQLDRHATLIEAKHTLDQLVLAGKEKEMLKNACNQIKYKHVVYEKWGFNKRLLYGRGVSMLFAGPPGTGKTMAAQVVASELSIDIYKVNLSQIVSKYIGETEKNLNILFDEAKKSSVILFFDETDALFGKRTEVKDSHDKNANLETSYLLQKMEEYDGITILSTNYLENIDKAFFRRISYVIHFSFPDVESRKKIWMSIFPEQVPLSDDIDFDYLASQFEISGGNIKNIAVVAAFLAAQSNEKVSIRHIVKAICYELTKQGKVLLKEDFGEHSYLIDL